MKLEVGRAQKTIFVARYLRLRDLQQEIEEGLNVMESSNGANSVIAYGKGGEIASNRRDEQEMFVLCLRILQSAQGVVDSGGEAVGLGVFPVHRQTFRATGTGSSRF
ncbi:Tn3 family transposase [Streptomyces sp. M10(2022)]